MMIHFPLPSSGRRRMGRLDIIDRYYLFDHGECSLSSCLLQVIQKVVDVCAYISIFIIKGISTVGVSIQIDVQDRQEELVEGDQCC